MKYRIFAVILIVTLLASMMPTALAADPDPVPGDPDPVIARSEATVGICSEPSLSFRGSEATVGIRSPLETGDADCRDRSADRSRNDANEEPTMSLQATYSGTCGDNLTWTLNTSTGELTISGTGAMWDWDIYEAPWYSYCSYIKTVTIGNSVTTIGVDAFFHCTSLTSVTIGNGVTTIDVDAFFHCTSLTSITVSSENPNYSSQDGVLFNKDKTIPIQCPGGKSGAYIIPDSVTTIGWGAFADCTSLTSVTIPNSVTTIDSTAFFNCTSLTSVTIGNSVTTIGNSAFYYCTSLTDVYYTGTELQWKQIKIGSSNTKLTNANIHYNSRGSAQYNGTGNSASKLYLTSYSPKDAEIELGAASLQSADAALQATGTAVLEMRFNQPVQKRNGMIRLHGKKTGEKSVSVTASSVVVDGSVVRVSLPDLKLKNDEYSVTVDSGTFAAASGDVFYGLNNTEAWKIYIIGEKPTTEVTMKYAKRGFLNFFKDYNKPAYPDASDHEYAQALASWARINGISMTTEQAKSMLYQPMRLPVVDQNGSMLLLNDGGTTVRQTLKDILFLENLHPFAVELDVDLHSVDFFEKAKAQGLIEGASKLGGLLQEKEIYETALDWYSQVDAYMKKRNGKSNILMSVAAPMAYTGLMELVSANGGAVYQYVKPLLTGTLDSVLEEKSLESLKNKADYATYKSSVSSIKQSYKLTKGVYKVVSDGKISFSTVKLAADTVAYAFENSRNDTLKKLGKGWKDFGDVSSAMSTCMFLGSSIGALPLVIELYNKAFQGLESMTAAFYFVGDYYIYEKYPNLYNAVIDPDTTFVRDGLDWYSTYLSFSNILEKDPLAHNWFQFLYGGTEKVNRNKCRQVRADLVNYILLLECARDFDAASAKKALAVYVSAELNPRHTASGSFRCPVKVKVFRKDNDALVGEFSSEDTTLPASEYGTFYLVGEDGDEKCFLLHSDDYYVEIEPYEDGTMDVMLSYDDGDNTLGTFFRDVPLKNGVPLRMDSLRDNVLQTEGITIAAEQTIPVESLIISGVQEIAVGEIAAMTVTIQPKTATEQNVTWSSSDPSVLTVDQNGQVRGITAGTAIVTASAAQGISTEHSVQVYAPATGLTIKEQNVDLAVGETYAPQAEVTGNPTHGIVWQSTDPSIASLDENGNIVALSEGTAIITATVDDFAAELNVTVNKSLVQIELYQSDAEGMRLKVDMKNPSQYTAVEQKIWLGFYCDGVLYGMQEVEASLQPHEQKTTCLELPEMCNSVKAFVLDDSFSPLQSSVLQTLIPVG